MTDTGQYREGTGGYEDVPASRERAERERDSGTLSQRMQTVIGQAMLFGVTGITDVDLRDLLPDWHHGQTSSALTNLHKAGHLVRLAERRDGCHPYVLPAFVTGRETLPYRPRTKDVRCPECGHQFRA